MNKSVVFDTPGTSVKNIKQDEHPYAVVLKNTKVEYGSNIPILGRLKPSNVVLNNCSLVVKRREFFVLLGASSAGKTTLLKAIVGLKNISQGEIWVLGGHPASIYHKTAGSKVGYMPQELAMFGELTIKETLNFFGMIYGMDESIWLFQMRKYSHVLKLPNLERPVKYLSGGQKRRLSFTIAILHKPQLIILDEPCVGVDPLVRKRMWDLLQVFVGKGRTVIMTTQYIEEANDASEVAFLYKGRIIAQDSPDGFKSKYSMPKLSDVFYKITNDDGTSSGPPAETSKAEEPEVKLEYIHTPFIRKIFPDMGTNKMQAMLFKNRIRYTRNWKLILFLLVLPIFQVAIFNATMGSPPAGLKMGVVNYELRGEFERSGNNSPYCPVNHDCLIKSPKARKSCTLLSCLDKDTIKLKYFPDEESAEEALKNGKLILLQRHSNNALVPMDDFLL
ncbi:ABC transporter G family member 23-like [Diaphorina citri]|uniref:ABC transporter G family member 23-like n=1 Tax=Diaphorina citri TaxID=121845 RepID=A0A3Q0J0V0_DIACI|nr:ABC transporter G family member 23-like [Diaphorina citri]